jgi:hypothetical protein
LATFAPFLGGGSGRGSDIGLRKLESVVPKQHPISIPHILLKRRELIISSAVSILSPIFSIITFKIKST